MADLASLLRAWLRATLAAAAALLLLACASAPAPRADEVRVRVATLGFDPASQSPVVMLVEDSGSRSLPIWIGVYEARSIAFALGQIPPPRPNSHDLLAAALRELGARVERVVISDLRDGTYYAQLLLAGRTRALDARPSDAIALALRTGAPVYVRSSVMDASPGAPSTQETAREESDLGRELVSENARILRLPCASQSGVDGACARDATRIHTLNSR